ncbi:23S rRNA (uracil(1939)-C(5))-methyltransferase RlmD [Eikenella sp. S3360]|uniref:23S rRNA (uracil(1939)-C(5))-methyltransferase RlmD n=1 Tax=Eikenella glucosivorans TaxID=2766967 RepID=A0ABS0N9A3_9NEIS|nr:23S rRNA (uracil(1939)-C(5))-methyltransferase RlmD [Eikenella glucosivorans]MBH5328862.1 23S rRNA (uracil(1939)-C(5))-methyltransferase RlmD [Eikenella glucosivorans]
MNTATIHSIDHEGRGVARIGGKTTFITGALPQETVAYRITRSKKHHDEAQATRILTPSPYRTAPACPHYSQCGGCTLQHAHSNAQVAYKQRILEEQLQRLGKVRPQYLLPPIYGQAWGYRHRARLSACHSQGQTLLGFQGRNSHRIINIRSCPILTPQLAAQLDNIRTLLQQLNRLHAPIRSIELHHSPHANALTLLTERLPQAARAHLIQAAQSLPANWHIWLQTPQQPTRPLLPESPQLSYSLPEYRLTLPYRPGDFTQVNPAANALLVSRAMQLLQPRPGERIADLFCGLGNFSLPIAAAGAHVTGIEGSPALTERAAQNARLNQLTERTRFHSADLFQTTEHTVAAWGRFNKILLDPPRSGAYALVQALHPPYLPRRIVYVSCNPATFARDAAVLVGKGYRFRSAGIVNMFPQTAHVETVGCFELE